MNRTRIGVGLVALVSTLGSIGMADAAPSGSAERNNRVTCDDHARSPETITPELRNDGLVVHGNTGTTYAGTGGVEACGDNGNSWRGRAIVSTDEGGYVAYDGATWASDPASEDNGCVRVDRNGPGQRANGSAEGGC